MLTNGASGSCKRALIVTDDAAVAASVKEGLCGGGIEVHLVFSPAAARSLIEADSRGERRFEVVCIDAALLARGGCDLLGEMSRSTASPKLAVLARSEPSSVRVVPVTHVPEPNDYGLLLEAPACPDVSGETAAFCRRHGLSGRESALLSLAVQGLNNDEAAERLGCHRCTVGTYWSRIFRKTRTSGQRDVLGKLLRGLYAADR